MSRVMTIMQKDMDNAILQMTNQSTTRNADQTGTDLASSFSPSLCSVFATLKRTLATWSLPMFTIVGNISLETSSASHASDSNCGKNIQHI